MTLLKRGEADGVKELSVLELHEQCQGNEEYLPTALAESKKIIHQCMGCLLNFCRRIRSHEPRREQVSVQQSPESQLVGSLVEAPRHWTFQPAEIDGQPIALKILLGIRLAPGR